MKRVAAAVLREDGQSAATVAAKLDTTPRTVERWSKRLKGEEGLAAAADVPRGGRPHMTDEAMDTAVAGASLLSPFASPHQLRRQLMLTDVSDDTVRRILGRAHIHAHIARHKRHLTPEQIAARLRFARDYSRFQQEHGWQTVFFADEKCFYGEGHPGRIWVYRPDEADSLDPQFTAQKVPHPIKVSAWACFSANGPGYMCIYDESADAKFFAGVFKNYLAPSHEMYFEPGSTQRWLLHDNLRAHRSHEPASELHKAGFTVLEFPPYSPDLNPIENLWADVQKRMDMTPVSTKAELEALIIRAWEATSIKLCSKLAHSMPKRIAAVIKKNGQYTHY